MFGQLGDQAMIKPIGFRFNPTDEELIEILEMKASGQAMPLHFSFILERNVYEREPEDIQWGQTVAVHNNERYCYYVKENDSREVTGRGWWKATSRVQKIYANNEAVVGYKRPLTFHRFGENERRRDKAIKTNWIMHEYSLESYSTEWRLCKIKYKKKSSVQGKLKKVNNDSAAASWSIMGKGAMQPAGCLGTEDDEQQQPVQPSQQVDKMMNQPSSDHHFKKQNMQLEVLMVEQQQQLQQSYAPYDPILTQIMSTPNDYLNFDNIAADQFELPDSSNELLDHLDLWSW